MEVTFNFTKCPTDFVVVTGEGGQVHLKCKNSIAVSGVGVGQRWWAISLVLSVNRLGKQSDHVDQFMLV